MNGTQNEMTVWFEVQSMSAADPEREWIDYGLDGRGAKRFATLRDAKLQAARTAALDEPGENAYRVRRMTLAAEVVE